MSDTYKGNGNYTLEYISLYTKDENTEEELVWDLAPFMVELSLFESLSAQTMSGYIAIYDTFNANELLPIYGNERVEVSFYTAGNKSNPITYIGYVYKVSEKHRITEQTSGYKISFCSEAAILSKRTFTQKAFNETASNIVSSIFETNLRNRSEKPLSIVNTKGVSTHVFGTLEPLEAISIVAKRAAGADGSLGFIFYENNQNFVFESLEHMYQRDIVASYSNRHGGIYDDVTQRHEEQFESYQDIKIDEENSFMDRMFDGIHGANFGYFDIKKKVFANFHYTKNDYFDPNKSLGDKPSKRFIDDGNDTQSIVYEAGDPYLYFDEVKGRMKRIESETFRAEVSVFGDSKLKIGDLIYLTVPNWNIDQEGVQTMFQGNVLIANIRHTITPTEYAQVLGVRKDAYREID